MSKRCYIGVNSVAKKVKKVYIGVGGVAKKIIKAYIGVDGVARLFFGDWKPSYFGEAGRLGLSKKETGAATTGNYAVFAGGIAGTYGDRCNTVDAYNEQLVRTEATPLPAAIQDISGNFVGDYALFAGGNADMYDNRTTVYTYSASLTQGTAPSLAFAHNNNPPAAHTENFAAFAGGHNYLNGSGADVTFYNTSLVKSVGALNMTKASAAGNQVGEYMIFAGGVHTEMNSKGNYVDTNVCTVEAFDAALTHYDLADLSYYKTTPASVGNYAIFLRGRTSEPDIYDKQLTKLKTSGFTCPVNEKSVTLGGYALIVGGESSDLVYSYNESLTLQQQESYIYPRRPAGMATVGEYAILAGGIPEDGSSTKYVEAYVLN